MSLNPPSLCSCFRAINAKFSRPDNSSGVVSLSINLVSFTSFRSKLLQMVVSAIFYNMHVSCRRNRGLVLLNLVRFLLFLVRFHLISKTPILAPFYKRRKPWPGFGPGTFALPRQRSTRLSYQGIQHQ